MKAQNIILLSAFTLALTLSAGLLFNIQPMIGKMLLPLVGGAPAVWNVAMAFFQISLLFGYFVAHGLSKLPPLGHGLAYIALLSIATLFLPIALPTGWRPTPQFGPALSVFSVLITSVALPFIALSLSAPTLQRLFSATSHPAAADPYFLYAASNFGSFAGLMAYPLWLEPHLTVPMQTDLWKTVYFTLIGIAVICVILQRTNSAARHTLPMKDVSLAPAAPVSSKTILNWILLAFIPSSLTLGVTTHISTDIAATPMLWAATLALYLLTFILAFARRGEALRRAAQTAAPWLAGLGISLTIAPLNLSWQEILLHLGLFTGIALACHSKLAQSRPHSSQLTSFYLWLSVGGALGGAFNAFLAPVIFNHLLEYPLVLLVALVLWPIGRTPNNRALILGLFAAAAVSFGKGTLIDHTNSSMTFMLFVFGTLLFVSQTNNRSLTGILGIVLTFLWVGKAGDVIFSDRDFFGTVSVAEDSIESEQADGSTQSIKVIGFDHGTTRHGVRLMDEPVPPVPTAYYSPRSPIGQVFSILHPKTITAIGLGSGAINCYSATDRHFTFIEIDALVENVARTYFNFITACPPPTIIIGDGRLEMANLPDHDADLIVLDAFASDSIPTHIVTEEAFRLYLSKLRSNGVIALHISNRFFNLEPMLAALTTQMGLQAIYGEQMLTRATPTDIHFATKWIVISPDPAPLAALSNAAPLWRPLRGSPDILSWRDDYSNLLSVFSLSH